ncbi:MAG: fused MFS/spermidine synthase [Planctomycetota bacterium]
MDGTRTAMAPWLLLLSGAAALMHQVSWVRLLGLSVGSTSEAVGIVLAAFFAGVALGSRLAGRIAARWPDLRAFGWLELVIAVSGVALLPVLLQLDVLVAAMPAIGRAHGARFVAAFGVMAVPTLAIGASFPVLAGLVAGGLERTGAPLGRLYAAHTAGAVLGTLLAGFLAIPLVGLDGAIYVAALLNVVAAAGAFVVAARERAARDAEAATRAADPLAMPRTGPPPVRLALPPWADSQAPHRRAALAALLTTGAVAVIAQIAWTKYLSIFTGSTIHGFALLLAGLLAGMALGSWAARGRLDRARPARTWLAGGLLALAACLLLTRAALGSVPALAQWLGEAAPGAGAALALRGALVFLLLLPPAAMLGALFPLSLSLYCGRSAAGGVRVGRGYAANTLAGIVGALLAGFVLVPRFGTDRALLAAVVLAGGVGLGMVPSMRAARDRRLSLGAAALLALGAFGLPALDYRPLVEAVDYRFDPAAREGLPATTLFLQEGRAGVVSVASYGDRYARLQINGLNESRLDREDPDNGGIAETLLGLVPSLLRPDARSAFVVGFGGGTTAAALTDGPLQRIRVVEMEPAVIDAVASVRGDSIPVLRDPRVQLTIADARAVLVAEPERYDILVSQPSHPWLAGAGNLYTREFFELADARLAEDGVFGQWVSLFGVDSGTLGSVLAAFYEVFPHGFTMVNSLTADMLLFGSRQPLVIDLDHIAERMAGLSNRTGLEAAGIREARDLLLYFSLSRDEALRAAGDRPPNTDTRLLTETRLGALHEDPVGADRPIALIMEHYTFDLRPYLPERTAARDLHQAGLLFLRWRATRNATMAAERLAELDVTLAGNLRRAIDELRGPAGR